MSVGVQGGRLGEEGLGHLLGLSGRWRAAQEVQGASGSPLLPLPAFFFFLLLRLSALFLSSATSSSSSACAVTQQYYIGYVNGANDYD